MKVLYIEDEKNIALPVINVLKKKGYLVDYSEEGKDGLSMALTNTYDCIILDLNLPGIDGIEISKRIRVESQVPILMLTARTGLDDKLKGFGVGADDYLPKPFELLELIARLDALIRRNSTNKTMELKIGNFDFLPERNVLKNTKNETEVVLSNKESGILEYLIRNKSKVVSAEELLSHVWFTNVNIFTDTVKTHIKTLRKKLGDNALLIKTIKGRGYIYD